MTRDFSVCLMICCCLSVIAASGYSVSSGKAFRVLAVEDYMADLYSDYLKRSTDRQRKEFNDRVAKGLSI